MIIFFLGCLQKLVVVFMVLHLFTFSMENANGGSHTPSYIKIVVGCSSSKQICTFGSIFNRDQFNLHHPIPQLGKLQTSSNLPNTKFEVRSSHIEYIYNISIQYKYM